MRQLKIQLHDDEYHRLRELKNGLSWHEFLISPHLPKLTLTSPDLRFNFDLACSYAKIGLSVKREWWPTGCKLYKSKLGLKLKKRIDGKIVDKLSADDIKSMDWVIARTH